MTTIATQLAVELYNLTDGEHDWPHEACMTIIAARQLDLNICQTCGRAGGLHAGFCDDAPMCDGCGVWPCRCDADYERGADK